MAIERVSAYPQHLSVETVSIHYNNQYTYSFQCGLIIIFQSCSGGGRRLGSCYSNQGGINSQNYQYGGQSSFGPSFGPGLGVAVGICCSSRYI